MNPLHDEVKRLHIALAELLKVARIYGATWVPKTNPSWQVYLARAEAALDGREPAVLEPVRLPVADTRSVERLRSECLSRQSSALSLGMGRMHASMSCEMVLDFLGELR